MLKEIHKSKINFCDYDTPADTMFDCIVDNLTDITHENLFIAQEAQAKRLSKDAHFNAVEIFERGEMEQKTKPKLAAYKIEPADIPIADLVFRCMTFDHIPEDLERKKTHKTIADRHVKLHFVPFKHYRVSQEVKDGFTEVVADDGNKVYVKEVLRSHYHDGEFNLTHGSITRKLAEMYLLMVKKYGERSNWRGYCVDEDTEALTQRGWLTHNEITTDDIILSYEHGDLKWSTIESVYSSEYNGKMFQLSSKGIDALITPNHKLVTKTGLTRVDYLRESDQVVLMGDAVQHETKTYSDELVELMGWIITEGNFQPKKNLVSIYQNEGSYAARIRHCLDTLGFRYSESDNTNICFLINVKDSKYLMELLPNKNLTMDIIVKLTTDQAKMLIETMVDGDGWRRGKDKHLNSYCQKDKLHVDLYQALCAISGQKTNANLNDIVSYGKSTQCYTIHTFSHNTTRGECIDMHGGKNNGEHRVLPGKEKICFPNRPTVDYNGIVWCPKTEYGCFMARRNGKVYLTGNTYIDEMKGQALLQLSQMGLQFNEAKSDNPFSYFTASVKNSFTRILNLEKRNQNIRDDLLEAAGQAPSHTRQNAHEAEIRKNWEEYYSRNKAQP